MSDKKLLSYHPNFIKYMKEIISHPNYTGLSINYKTDKTPVWVATKKSKTSTVGVERVAWADKKAITLGFENSNKKYADTMFAIHPTKKKVCQCCGETMDLRYIYPTKNTVKDLENKFSYSFNKYDSIYDIIEKLRNNTEDIKQYLIKKSNLTKEYMDKPIDDIVEQIEVLCRMKGKKIFSPGAMSNFPDRFDGFHSYNLCCRKLRDKGRHDSNMATYNKDRRAYEYWADGNIAAANQLMRNNKIFKGMTADHIGPISLGFIHDPLYLQPMHSSDNSSKRDKLTAEDIDKLIKKENSTNISPASKFSIKIWEFVKNDYLTNKKYTIDEYRDILKRNMANFMESLWILFNSNERKKIEVFFSEMHFSKKYEEYFKYRYTFNSDGTIKTREIRNITDSSSSEFERFKRISFESIEDFHKKSRDNRKLPHSLTKDDINQIINLQKEIISENNNYEELWILWNTYLDSFQYRLLENLK